MFNVRLADDHLYGKWLFTWLSPLMSLIPPPLPTPPSNFIAGRPKAALLFWFFGGFRCGVWFRFVSLVRYKNRK